MEVQLECKRGTYVLWVNALGHFDMAWLTIEGGQPMPSAYNMHANIVTDKKKLSHEDDESFLC